LVSSCTLRFKLKKEFAKASLLIAATILDKDASVISPSVTGALNDTKSSVTFGLTVGWTLKIPDPETDVTSKESAGTDVGTTDRCILDAGAAAVGGAAGCRTLFILAGAGPFCIIKLASMLHSSLLTYLLWKFLKELLGWFLA
jgi:hypothetical protein